MKKTLLILSAIALSGSAVLIAQEGRRDAPQGGQRRGGGGAAMFVNAPLFKALGINEQGEIPLTEENLKDLAAKIKKLDKNDDKKLTRDEYFGEFRRGGRRGADGAAAGGTDRPRRPRAGTDNPE